MENNSALQWRRNTGPKPLYDVTKPQDVEKIAAAITENRGIITYAAQDLGVSNPTLYNYIEQSIELQTAVFYARERRKDDYEKRLDRLADDDNAAAVIFFLKTQAKDRGYIERTEIDSNINIQIGLPDDFNPPTAEDADFDLLSPTDETDNVDD